MTVSAALFASLPATSAQAKPTGGQSDRAANAAIERAQSIFAGGDARSERGQQPTSNDEPESLSLALADVFAALPTLSGAERKAAENLLARPDGSGTGTSNDAVAWNVAASWHRTTCGTNVCVHYVDPGSGSTHAPPSASWAATTLTELQNVWTYETSTMGYRAPATDATVGGDSRFDVYLANLGALGLYGYCAPEYRVPGQDFRASAYCVLDDDFVEFPLGPLPSLQVTAAHEFFHAVQFNYDAAEDAWIMEATATWMEERYADPVNDNVAYIRHGQIGRPTVPLDTFGGLGHYGNWVFFERLSQSYGVGAVRSIWSRLDATTGAPDQYGIQAIKSFLTASGTTLPKFYANFAAGNLAPAKVYSEGSLYTATKTVKNFKFKRKGQTKSVKAGVRHLTAKSYRFKSKVSGKIKFTIKGPKSKTGPAVLATIYKKSGAIKRKYIKLSGAGKGSGTVKFKTAKVSKVTLTLVNASTRFERCYTAGTPYSCSGVPLDDNSKFAVSARLV
ncbi:MAG: MXAN_6640 family putative metalloprotease [Nocardioides sp.]